MLESYSLRSSGRLTQLVEWPPLHGIKLPLKTALNQQKIPLNQHSIS